jgi:hypothetical protein
MRGVGGGVEVERGGIEVSGPGSVRVRVCRLGRGCESDYSKRIL